MLEVVIAVSQKTRMTMGRRRLIAKIAGVVRASKASKAREARARTRSRAKEEARKAAAVKA